jgi:hypothetical protein
MVVVSVAPIARGDVKRTRRLRRFAHAIVHDVKGWIVALVAIAGFGSARVARVGAASQRAATVAQPPYAPTAAAAPFLTLGYRELAADLLMIRLVGYFGDQHNEAAGIADLAEAVVALDPTMRRAYDVGAVAMNAARSGVTNEIHLRAIKLLEAGERAFPTYWRFPNLAGQIYLVDLQTDDPAQRREWDERGALLLESAARKPTAPAEAAMHAAILQTRFGRRERALAGLREMLLITSDNAARQRLIDKIAELADEDADVVAAELLEARTQFERTWKDARPAINATMFILLGPRIAPGFDLGDLATGGRDLVGTEGFERLEPLTDEPTNEPTIVPTPAP